MRLVLSFISFIVTAAILGGVALFVWGYNEYRKPVSLDRPVLLEIERGMGVTQIADRLTVNGVVSQPLLFRITAKLKKQESGLHAGEYEFTSGMTMADILNRIVSGHVFQRQFTVPEGLTSWQVVKLLNETEGLSGKIETVPKEGSLLPETYNYVRGDSRQDKIVQMQKAMKEELARLWRGRSENLPVLSEVEAIILASIVEKETGLASERRRIAGVFMNRLRKGMKLQTDPTVIYAITQGQIEDKGQGPLGRRILTKDLKFESPYNTYKYTGLPPGPIANPGRESLAAVLNPEPHDFYYFVADGTGGHIFARTLEEHNRNVARWRKIRNRQ